MVINRVQACVGCEVVVPRPQRPTDGLLYFNVLPSPMAAPDYDIGRYDHVHVHVL